MHGIGRCVQQSILSVIYLTIRGTGSYHLHRVYAQSILIGYRLFSRCPFAARLCIESMFFLQHGSICLYCGRTLSFLEEGRGCLHMLESNHYEVLTFV